MLVLYRYSFALYLAIMIVGCGSTSLPPAPTAEQTGDLRNVFAQAVLDGNLEKVTSMLATEPLLLNEPVPTIGYLTPLHFAAKSGNEAMVRYLLEQGADPYAMDDEGQLPQDVARLSDASENLFRMLQVR